jgi:precorrin-6B methylase 2
MVFVTLTSSPLIVTRIRHFPRLLRIDMPALRNFLILCLAFAASLALAQERFSLFVPSEQENVERMLKLVELRDDDVVVDLGSGDGRIVLAAARMNSKLRGWGVEIDEKLVRESNATAQAQGVADRVQFFHRNAFDADLRDATVIAMWLWPEMQRLLRPLILAHARPGARVVTNIWDLGTWPPDAVDPRDGQPVSMWIVPARVDGHWSWELTVGGRRIAYAAVLEQHFQSVEGVARAGVRREVLHDVKVRGEDLSFTLGMTLQDLGYARHEFRGKVRGESVEGIARILLPDDQIQEVPWRATRAPTSAYFEPTGTDIQ